MFKFLIVLCINLVCAQVNWNGEDWARDCDLSGNDFSHTRSTAEQCSNKCRENSECTHFAWTNYNGGTCWMKKGQVSKKSAVYRAGAVCGVISSRLHDGRLLFVI